MATLARFTLLCCVASMMLSSVDAAPVPYWFDGYDVSGPSLDINFENAARQGGAPTPVTYVTNTADPSNDYHHQVFGAAPLQLAGDPNLTTILASPNLDFSGTIGGQVIGKKIDVVMDANALNPTGVYFTNASLTVGSSAPLDVAGTGADGFSVRFVEDTFAGNGNFIQIFDGSGLTANLIPNPVGGGAGFVEIFVDDPSDGNPWDGVGATVFDVYVGGTQIDANDLQPGLSHTAAAANYTSNFITLEGFWDSANFGLATHTFDNLLVSTDVIPEPATASLVALFGIAAVMRRRR